MILWDTSGSERYLSIAVAHYRNALGAMLVFDFTSRVSFTNLPYWINAIRENAHPNCVIYLVGNKDEPSLEQHFRITDDEIYILVKEHDLIYSGRTSALLNKNVNECFEDLIKQTYADHSLELNMQRDFAQILEETPRLNRNSVCC